MCLHAHHLLRCPRCSQTSDLFSSAYPCDRLPNLKITCDEFTTTSSDHNIVCYRCNNNPNDTAETYELTVLSVRLHLRKEDLEHKLSPFSNQSSWEWEGYWKKLRKESRDLFVDVWKLEAEIAWLKQTATVNEVVLGNGCSEGERRAIHW